MKKISSKKLSICSKLVAFALVLVMIAGAMPASTAKAATASVESYAASVTTVGTWSSGDLNFYQIQVELSNNHSEQAEGWSFQMNLPSDSSLSQSWNGVTTLDGGKLSVTPCDYNTVIQGGSSVSYGCIFSTTEMFDEEECYSEAIIAGTKVVVADGTYRSEDTEEQQYGATALSEGSTVSALPSKYGYGIKLVSSWGTGDQTSYQLEMSLSNNSSKATNNWAVAIQFPSNMTFDGGWCGSYELEGNVLTIKSVDWNRRIATSNTALCGFIVTGPAGLDVNALSSLITVNKKTFFDNKDISNEVEKPVPDETKETETKETETKETETKETETKETETKETETKETETKETETKETGTKETKETGTDEAGKETVESGVIEESEPAGEVKPAELPATSPVAAHGQLSVSGTKIVDANGNPFQLRGVSTHGIAWFPQYVNKDAFATLESYGANVIRLALYSDPGAGFKTDLYKNVDAGVSYATELGMYVLIDWHILSDGNPQTNKVAAKEFFAYMSQKYANYNNVLYEICNEPNGSSWEKDIKPYAEEIIDVIRDNDDDAIIIVGTPTWSQDVDLVAKDPIQGESNIMYAMHFYAATHTDSYRQKLTTALNAGLPVLITEFGMCDASGSGNNDFSQAKSWIDVLDANGVGYICWNLSNKSETSALINPSCTKTSGWTAADLSQSGQWYFNLLQSYK